jgi:hypothetical protein
VNAAGGQRLVALAIRAQPPDADHEPFASTSRVDQVNFGDHVRRQLPFSATPQPPTCNALSGFLQR